MSKKLTQQQFEYKSNLVHNNLYDYSKSVYIDNNTYVTIICNVEGHGEFPQIPSSHMNGNGCPKCAGNEKLTKQQFEDKSNLVHNKFFCDGYTDVIYIDNRTPVDIKCPVEGHGIFTQTPSSHMNGNGCPKCRNSRGETETERILIKYNIAYEKQKKFDYCKHKNRLPFDFYLIDRNILIEFDGEQHFNKRSRFNKKFNNFESIQRNDKIKTDYCINNNIELIRIHYKEFRNKNIENYLKNKLNII